MSAEFDIFRTVLLSVLVIVFFSKKLVAQGAQTVKNLSAMWETQVPTLGQEDPWEKEMDTHSSICAGRIPWREEPGGLQSTGFRSQTRLSTHTHIHTKIIIGKAPPHLWRPRGQLSLPPRGSTKDKTYAQSVKCCDLDCVS